MKTIVKYIKESFVTEHLSTKVILKNDNNVLAKICKAVGLNRQEDKDILDIIKKFFDDNNVTSIEIVAAQEIIDYNEIPKSASKYYTIDGKLYDEISKNKFDNTLYSEDTSFGFNILSSNNILSLGFNYQDPVYVVCI